MKIALSPIPLGICISARPFGVRESERASSAPDNSSGWLSDALPVAAEGAGTDHEALGVRVFGISATFT